MTRRAAFVMTVAVVFAALGGPALAHAAAQGSKVVAQQSSDPCAVVGQVLPEECTGGNSNSTTGPGFASQQPLPPGADPPGAMVRSLVMIVLLGVAFFVYVGWALQRGAPPV